MFSMHPLLVTAVIKSIIVSIPLPIYGICIITAYGKGGLAIYYLAITVYMLFKQKLASQASI